MMTMQKHTSRGVFVRKEVYLSQNDLSSKGESFIIKTEEDSDSFSTHVCAGGSVTVRRAISGPAIVQRRPDGLPLLFCISAKVKMK